MHRVLVLLAATSACGALLAGSADAAPRTLAGRYTTGLTVPDPTTGGTPNETCEGLPSSRHRRSLALPSGGVLKVVLTSSGDYGLSLRDARGRALARSDTSFLDGPERASVRLRRRGTVLVDACNFAGAPTATVTWTFTRSP